MFKNDDIIDTVIPGPETREESDKNVDDDEDYLVKGLQNATAN